MAGIETEGLQTRIMIMSGLGGPRSVDAYFRNGLSEPRPLRRGGKCSAR